MTTHRTPRDAPAIEAEGLTRTFRTKNATVTAVDGLDLAVGPGELVAFLGPNGAGKSTTLRMLTTLLPPTSGTARVGGHDVGRDARRVRGIIGYVGQGNGAGHWHHGRDELIGQARAHGMARAAARARVAELTDALELDGVLDRKVSTLSGGQRRRLDVALGLMHAPDVLFLDEPSTGLDPQNRANMQEQIRRMHRDSGATVVLTTHYLEEADALAERVVVIDHGRVIADDSARALKSGLGDRVALDVAPGDAAAVRARLAAAAGGEPEASPDGRTLRVLMPDGRARVARLLADLAADGVVAEGVSVVAPTLDDVFLSLTGRSLRDGARAANGSPRPEEVAA